jgi:lysozyme
VRADLDAASERQLVTLDQHIARLRDRNYTWPIPWDAVEYLARIETCRLSAYLCQAGVLTCGWGETDGVIAATTYTEDEADVRLFDQVSVFTKRVETMLKHPATPNQLGALVSLAYNIGLAALNGSTVLRQHNRGNFAAAADAFELWDKYRDPVTRVLKVSNGLRARRAAEKARYLRLEVEEGVPQAVIGRRW